MTHTQQTTREVLEQAYARALKLHNDHWMHWSDDDIANSNENLSLFRAMLAHPTPSTTGEAERLYDAIKECLLNHRLQSFMGEDEEHYPLVDHLTHGNSLADGQHEIALICDSIYNTVLKPATPPQVEPAPNPEQALQRLSELGQQLQPEEFEAPKRPPNCGTGHCSCIECVMEPAPSTAGERDAKPMTAHRAVYFMERFKREEKLLGPNEQAAIDYVIALLQSTADHIPDAGKMVAAMPVGELTLEQITRIYDRYGGDMVNCTRAIERELAAASSQQTSKDCLQVDSSQPVREPLPLMSEAFRTTVAHGPSEDYRMVFKFKDLDSLHAADDEWRKFRGAP